MIQLILFIIWAIGFIGAWILMINEGVWHYKVKYEGETPKYPHFWRFCTMLNIAVFWPVILAWAVFTNALYG